jgi:hypothetical protein
MKETLAMDLNAIIKKRKQGRPGHHNSQKKRLKDIREYFDNDGEDRVESIEH